MPIPPLISICIPAYKRIEFLSRLLDSVVKQTFRDFEVIVTDDSPGHEVSELCLRYQDRLPLYYFRNEKTLGTPENWNEGVRKAGGKWIKIMHDDDWFAEENSLAIFATAIDNHPEADFIFSAYRDIFLDDNKSREMFMSASRYKAFLSNRTTLFSKNIIGPPSVVLYKKEGEVFFDNTVKWVVDIDFYIRYLADRNSFYINEILINVGLGSHQVTVDCFRLRPIEIPENFYLLNKVGVHNLRNIYVYDSWWRLLRNLEIRSPKDISESGYSGDIPAVILSMITWQRRVSLSVLRIGIFSKVYMFLHYIFHFNRIRA